MTIYFLQVLKFDISADLRKIYKIWVGAREFKRMRAFLRVIEREGTIDYRGEEGLETT